MNLIFLDIDGVLNCELFYRSKQHIDFRANFKHIEEDEFADIEEGRKAERQHNLEYYSGQICKERIGWLNDLCKETESKIVVSSSWRGSQTVEELQEMFNFCGGTFIVLDKTGYCDCRVRGVEIRQWLQKNCMKYFGVEEYDFYKFSIIDDDADMLLLQQNHFFQTDTYSGLTPTTCYKIKQFFTHETF